MAKKSELKALEFTKITGTVTVKKAKAGALNS